MIQVIGYIAVVIGFSGILFGVAVKLWEEN